MAATRNDPPGRPWSVPVVADEVPESGRHCDLVADEPTRTAVAKLASLRTLPKLTASFDVTRHGRNGLHVIGTVSATVGQVCVVTLDPVEEKLKEPVDVIFSPQKTGARDEDHELELEVTADDSPEPLIGGVVDLGALATEFLILGINPDPRKSDAEFESPAAGDDSGHPFAALAALKKGEGQQ
jgi:uncharacterized metal-binding protein YceD (DUF177 family)